MGRAEGRRGERLSSRPDEQTGCRALTTRFNFTEIMKPNYPGKWSLMFQVPGTMPDAFYTFYFISYPPTLLFLYSLSLYIYISFSGSFSPVLSDMT